MSKNRVSLADIALQAKVHITTVSLAMRNSPRLPDATKARIQKIAEEMGYEPDPMLSALTAYRRNAKLAHHQGTLAWISNTPQRSFLDYHKGAVERCQELGYILDEFDLAETKAPRLSRVLRARNIQGLLIAPQARNRAHLNLAWNEFSAVTFGHTLVRPQLHMVTNAQFRSARICVRSLRSRGYRRIAFVTTHDSDERTDQNFTSGFIAEQSRFKPQEKIPPLILPDSTVEEQIALFAAWFSEHRPQALAVHYNRVAEFMEKLGISYKECGLATTARPASERILAGIDQNDVTIGRTAVDFVVGMIHRNERGIPAIPLRILVQGTWIDGKTVERKQMRASSEAAML